MQTILSAQSTVSDNHITKVKEKRKVKERVAAAAVKATGEAGAVEEKENEARVTKAVGPGSRKAIATTVRRTNTHVSLDTQMCVVGVVTRVRAHWLERINSDQNPTHT